MLGRGPAPCVQTLTPKLRVSTLPKPSFYSMLCTFSIFLHTQRGFNEQLISSVVPQPLACVSHLFDLLYCCTNCAALTSPFVYGDVLVPATGFHPAARPRVASNGAQHTPKTSPSCHTRRNHVCSVPNIYRKEETCTAPSHLHYRLLSDTMSATRAMPNRSLGCLFLAPLSSRKRHMCSTMLARTKLCCGSTFKNVKSLSQLDPGSLEIFKVDSACGALG